MSSQSQSVTIIGTGSYAPKNVVTNDDLAKTVDTSDEWIRTRSGIGARHFAAKDETTSDMACIAAERAIEAAGIERSEIDLIILATMTPDMAFPSTACLVQSKLGLPNVTTFDMQAACSGFVYALSVANSMLLSGNFKKALVIGAEKMSGILDFEDRTTCVLFGDGAGAAVLSATETTDDKVGVLGTICGADGSNPSLLQQPGGGSAMPAPNESIAGRQHFLKMNGKEIFKSAVRVMGQASTDIVEQMGYTPEDLNLVIPHQANMRIIKAIASRAEVSMDKLCTNLDRVGNISAASVPVALDEAVRAGKIKEGDAILFVVFGGGFTWGAMDLRW